MRINRWRHYWAYAQVRSTKISPTITYKIRKRLLTPNTAEILCLKLSQGQFADRLEFYYLLCLIQILFKFVECKKKYKNY